MYLDAIGQRLHPPLLISLGRAALVGDAQRTIGVAARRRACCSTCLVQADARATTVRSHRYYARGARPRPHGRGDRPRAVAERDRGDRRVPHGDARRISTRPACPRPGQTPAAQPSGPPPARRRRGRRPIAPRPRRAAAEPARPIEELLAELDALVGLDAVKAEVRRLSSLLQVQALRAERGCRRSRPATTSCSPATRAPARPPWPGCSRRSTAASASCRRATWWRPTAPTSSPGSSARRR